jgi:hypothetical protein
MMLAGYCFGNYWIYNVSIIHIYLNKQVTSDISARIDTNIKNILKSIMMKNLDPIRNAVLEEKTINIKIEKQNINNLQNLNY